MNEFFNVGKWVLGLFSDLWIFLYNDADWIGIAILGFVVMRFVLMIFRAVTAGALRGGDE